MQMQVDMVSVDNQFAGAFDQNIKPLLAHFGIDCPDLMLSRLSLDSRDGSTHCGFIAIKGHNQDGRDYIPQAIQAETCLILVECDEPRQHGIQRTEGASLIIQFYQLRESISSLAGHFYQQPANSLSVTAVTGTNGKTSTVQLIAQLTHLLGEQAATIGTLGAGVYRGVGIAPAQETINTTPDPISMQALLADFVAEGTSQVALEASSHALTQRRIAAIKTDVAVMTNLSRDHLDYHGTMSEYAAAKRLLLNQPELRFLVINGNDPEAANWLSQVSPKVQVLIFGTVGESLTQAEGAKYCVAKAIRYTHRGMHLSLDTSWGHCELKLGLMGKFNALNVLAAIGSQLCLGNSLKSLAYIAQKLRPVAGRMELFNQPIKPAIIVDYAHTPDGLEQALLAAKQHCQGRLVCIFGCGGDRDQGKRAMMGEIAERLADHVIITDDNVRGEDPESITQEILTGCQQAQNIKVIHDRKLAIQHAVQTYAAQDMILVAGKGHEPYQIIGNQRLAYDERQYVSQLLKGKG
jgi:UDP-N-acetylmuramoyl-L-alanyl-D-glutamate--2,6-diaminopimelate ligase